MCLNQNPNQVHALQLVDLVESAFQEAFTPSLPSSSCQCISVSASLSLFIKIFSPILFYFFPPILLLSAFVCWRNLLIQFLILFPCPSLSCRLVDSRFIRFMLFFFFGQDYFLWSCSKRCNISVFLVCEISSGCWSVLISIY